jgi:hypothetical protein
MIDAERRELFPGDVMLPLGLIEADYPKRVISGTWSEAFSAVCDRLAETIGAERFSLTGGHSAQRAPEFNELLTAVVQGQDG